MKAALVQCNPTVGDLDGNLRRAAERLREARAGGARLIAFPELALVGYPPQDLLLHRHFIAAQARASRAFAAMTRSETAVFGFVERGRDGRLYNAAAAATRGKIVAVYRKRLLPNYDVFDERRWFAPGEGPPRPMPIGGEAVGVHICEDLWDAGYQEKPVDAMGRAGVSFFLNISASPYDAGKLAVRMSLARAKAKKNGVPYLYVNLVGGQDEILFDGSSFALDGRGRLCALAPSFEEALVFLDTRRMRPLRKPKPVSREEETYRALVMGLRDYARKNGFREAVVGLSGGVDSSLVACLAADALGARNVLGVMMPSRFTSSASARDAVALARHLGLRLYEIPIEEAVELNRRQHRRAFGRPCGDIADQNLQARERGKILMMIANDRNALLLTTGNKTELAVGYCTLYGDMSGGLAVISDLDKHAVYRLARWRNRGTGVIPRGVFTKPPSAELAPNQRDEDTLPPYAILVPVVNAFVEEGLGLSDIVRRGYDQKVVRWILNRIRANEYKRRQAAPGLRVTRKAFGIGRRYPITNGWRF